MSHRIRFILAVLPVSFIAMMSWYGVFTFVNGFMIKQLGATNEEWTATTLWLIGGMIFWQFVVTDVSARIGRRRAMTLSILAVAAGFAGLALTTSLQPIGPLLAVISLGQAACNVVWVPMLAEVGRDRPGRIIALTTLINTSVGVAALLAGGWLASSGDTFTPAAKATAEGAGGYHFRLAFAVIAGLAAALAVAFRYLARHLETAKPTDIVSLHRLSRADWATLLRGPFLVLIVAGIALEPFNFHTINQLFPNLARDVHGLGEGAISSIVALGRLPSLITLFLVARVVDRAPTMRWYGAALLATSVIVILLGLAPTSAALIGLYGGFYLFHGAIWATNSASINAAVDPRLRDAAFAIMAVVSNLSLLVVGAFHNRLLDRKVTLPHVFVICACVCIASGLMLIAGSWTKRWGLPVRHTRWPSESKANAVVEEKCV